MRRPGYVSDVNALPPLAQASPDEPAADPQSTAEDAQLSAAEVAVLREKIEEWKDDEESKPWPKRARAAAAAFVFLLLALAAWYLSQHALGANPEMGAEKYLAVVAAGGGLGLALGPFATVMTGFGYNEDNWKFVAAVGKVSAGMWATVVSLVTAIG